MWAEASAPRNGQNFRKISRECRETTSISGGKWTSKAVNCEFTAILTESPGILLSHKGSCFQRSMEEEMPVLSGMGLMKGVFPVGTPTPPTSRAICSIHDSRRFKFMVNFRTVRRVHNGGNVVESRAAQPGSPTIPSNSYVTPAVHKLIILLPQSPEC